MKKTRLYVPEKGRTSIETLTQLERLNWIDPDIADRIKNILVQDKKRIKSEAKIGNFSKLEDFYIDPDMAPYLHLQPDVLREGYPPRITFNMLESKTSADTPLLIKGCSHYDAPQKLRGHEADIVICGWDELYASLISNLEDRAQHIGKWSAFNYYLQKYTQEGDSVKVKNYKATDITIAGSAGLDDYVGHFFIFPENKKRDLLDEKRNITLESIDTIYIDPKFAALYKAILAKHDYTLYDEPHVLFPYGKELEFVGVEDVEDAVIDENGVGIEIVQTGSTLKDKNLAIASYPILQSETIIATTNLDEYGNAILNSLNPLRYDASDRKNSFNKWCDKLSGNVGENWLNYPGKENMFLSKKDLVTWWLSYSGKK